MNQNDEVVAQSTAVESRAASPEHNLRKLQASFNPGLEHALCGAMFASIAALLIIRYSPYLLFRYEIDPSDGDIMNAAVRLFHGLPIYSDWSRGRITTVYAPGYFYYLLIGQLFHVDTVIFGRISNVCFLLSSIGLGALLVAQVFEDRVFRVLGVAVCLYFINLRIEGFDPIVNLRSDGLALLFALASLVVAATRSHSIGGLALFVVLASLTKQSALVVPLGFSLYFLLCQRRELRRFLSVELFIGGALIVLLEIENNGYFLRDTFLLPPTIAGTSANWEHFYQILGNFYPTNASYIVFAIASFGALHLFRTRSTVRPVVFVAVLDLLLYLKSGHNDGGGPSYLWLHWMLTSILASVGLVSCAQALSRAAFTNRSNLAREPVRQLVGATAALILVGSLPYAATIEHAGAERDKYEALSKVGDDYAALVAKISAEHPGAQWYAERFASSIVRTGNTLDIEACTLGYAERAESIVKERSLRHAIRRGEYRFIQHSGIAPIHMIDDYLASHYHLIAASRIPDRGQASGVQIYEFNHPRVK